MREIKFRAWDKETKNICEVRSINFKHKTVRTSGLSNCDFKDVTLMQFTGLQDKNGVDIYEGDIITYQYMFADNKSTFEVKWNSNGNGFYVGNEDGYFCLEKELKNQFEVIGNIYENPELLEVE